jgi:hypothetical protein
MLLLLAVAFAQENDVLTDDAEARTRYQTVTILEFERVAVDAQLVGPSGSIVLEPPVRSHPSLIQLRASFDDEMAASVDAVR